MIRYQRFGNLSAVRSYDQASDRRHCTASPRSPEDSHGAARMLHAGREPRAVIDAMTQNLLYSLGLVEQSLTPQVRWNQVDKGRYLRSRHNLPLTVEGAGQQLK